MAMKPIQYLDQNGPPFRQHFPVGEAKNMKADPIHLLGSLAIRSQ